MRWTGTTSGLIYMEGPPPNINKSLPSREGLAAFTGLCPNSAVNPGYLVQSYPLTLVHVTIQI